jgi:hypothetical protein
MSDFMKRLPWKAIAVAALLAAEVGVLSLVAWSANSGPMFGVVVAQSAASITMSDQTNVVHTVAVQRIVSPTDGWVIVQADNNSVPDAILGSRWIPSGESRDVTIGIDPLSPLPKQIFVTLLADMGAPHVLEYYVAMRPGMETMRGMGSTFATGAAGAVTLDKPLIAGGMVVTAHANVSATSFAVGANQASLSDATRTVDATAVVIPRVLAPAQSWVSASLETTSGQIGEILGSQLVPSGESTHVVIPLSTPPGNRAVIATLHVDLGTVGQFDFSPQDLGNSSDQPYVAGGQTVSVPVRIVR